MPRDLPAGQREAAGIGMPRLRIGIAGAGLLGRLLAFELSSGGHAVTVFDASDGAAPAFDGQGSAAFTAAGMLSPIAELVHADAAIAWLGMRSLARWRQLAMQLRCPEAFVQRGSLILAHRSDMPLAQRMLQRIASAALPLGRFSHPAGAASQCSAALPLLPPSALMPSKLCPYELAVLEPELHGMAHAWLLRDEAHVDTLQIMQSLFDGAVGVRWWWDNPVTKVGPGRLHTRDGSVATFDHVFDVRGTGARPEMPVRGVRGETVWLHAPGHRLTRPVRLVHARHPLYLVPRAGERIMLGASEIESDDRSPVSLRTAVELMSAAFSVMPSLAEARIVRLDRNLRPALPDNAPLIVAEDGITRINGLFRHGWLIAPALVHDALVACGLACDGDSHPHTGSTS